MGTTGTLRRLATRISIGVAVVAIAAVGYLTVNPTAEEHTQAAPLRIEKKHLR
jgi:hypothetical protein